VRERTQLARLDLLHDVDGPVAIASTCASSATTAGPAPVYGMLRQRKSADDFSISIGTCIVP